jgi:ribosomal protein S2
MEKGGFRMGINYKYKTRTSLNKYSNKDVKTGFYNSLILFGDRKTNWNPNTSNYLLGQRDDFNIINSEIQLEMLKRIKKFSYEIAKKKGKVLYVNESTNAKFDGILKFLSYRAGQIFIGGRWPCGLITKNNSLEMGAILLFNPCKSEFPIKESNKLGIPIISFNSLHTNVLKTMYPIILNNYEGSSLFFSTLILTNSILEGKLFAFTKKYF